ncbi:MAG: N-acetylmuramoyl-L-alanine amidase [bacterium]|nr:N-acetylmuramoyl-L-alanine amidase [bacterium]
MNKFFYSGAFAIFVLVLFLANETKVFSNMRTFVGSVFFMDSSTERTLKDAYTTSLLDDQRPVKILIVPGHDDKYFGAQFRGLREANINLELAEKLAKLFRAQGRFSVTVTRTQEGYNPVISDFLEREESAILAFVKQKKETMGSLIDRRIVGTVDSIEHVFAPGDTAFHLYGINYFANKNSFDIVLHIHFNDYPREDFRVAGKYKGVAIYIPESQYSNFYGSRALAEKIFERLLKFYPQSSFQREAEGIIPSQDLIAIGAYNTLDSAALLLEYGYLYEPQFQNEEIRDKTLDELALQTYIGTINLLGISYKTKFGSANLGRLDSPSLEYKEAGADVLKLQTALLSLNMYPPKGKTFLECPLSGIFFRCTKQSVLEFQVKYGISPALGYAGPITIKKLNAVLAE